jgi:hypothetical protein
MSEKNWSNWTPMSSAGCTQAKVSVLLTNVRCYWMRRTKIIERISLRVGNLRYSDFQMASLLTNQKSQIFHPWGILNKQQELCAVRATELCVREWGMLYILLHTSIAHVRCFSFDTASSISKARMVSWEMTS